MEVIKALEAEDVKIDKFPFRGIMNDVIGISVRWLSKQGDDGNGNPEYGLRLFTSQPGGSIPIHNHYYHQTMYILSGEFECWEFDPETDEMTEKKLAPAGTSVFVQSMKPHGMKNTSETEEASFLCCICNVYDDDDVV